MSHKIVTQDNMILLGIKDEKEVRGLKKKVDLLNEKNRTLEIRNQKDQQDLERIKNEKSELTKSLTRYQERIDKGNVYFKV